MPIVQTLMTAVVPGTPQEFDSVTESATRYSGQSCTTGIRLNADGSYESYTDGDTSSGGFSGNWIDPQVGMNQFEVQCVITAGSTPSTNAAVGSGNWTALGGANLYWEISSSSGFDNSRSFTATFTVRKIGTTSPTYVSSGVGITSTTDTNPPP